MFALNDFLKLNNVHLTYCFLSVRSNTLFRGIELWFVRDLQPQICTHSRKVTAKCRWRLHLLSHFIKIPSFCNIPVNCSIAWYLDLEKGHLPTQFTKSFR